MAIETAIVRGIEIEIAIQPLAIGIDIQELATGIGILELATGIVIQAIMAHYNLFNSFKDNPTFISQKFSNIIIQIRNLLL